MSALLALMIALMIAVRTGAVDPVDHRLRELARPADVWGSWQLRADLVVEGLRPVRTCMILFIVAAAVALARRSPRPLAAAAAIMAATAMITIVLKDVLARPDPHGALAGHGGSFPSGHTAVLVVAVGAALRLVTPARSAAAVASAAAGAIMGACLTVQAAHWASDVIGGLLLGGFVLVCASAVGLDRWARGGEASDDDPRRADAAAFRIL